MNEELKEKIMQRVQIDPETGCWNWVGSLLKSGIPCLYWERKTITVRRELFKIEFGDIEESCIQVKNTCLNKLCVSPNHLLLSKGNTSEIKKFHKKKYKTPEEKKEANKKNRRSSWLKLKEKKNIPDKKYNFAEYVKKRKEQTHCKRGHSLDDAIITRKGRSCRVCNRKHAKKYREKKKQMKGVSV